MATVNLSAEARSGTGKGAARQIRRDGRVPAVVYGHGRDPESLSVNARDLERMLERNPVGSTVIEIALGGRTSRMLIREVQRHPVKRNVLHVDFQELVAGERIAVSCPITYVGTADGVRNQGGVLDQIMHELRVEVDPSNVPSHIDVDVTPLTIGHALHVSDLTLPEGVRVLDDPATTVAIVSPPKIIEEEEVAAPADESPSAEPEVIRAKKADDEK